MDTSIHKLIEELKQLGVTRRDYMFDSDYKLTKAILKASRNMNKLTAARQVANALAILETEIKDNKWN